MSGKRRGASLAKNRMAEPLAIVGLSCRFPGLDADVTDLDAFYQLLLSGKTSIRDVPASRWDAQQYYHADRERLDKIASKKGSFLQDPSLFDVDYFKLSAVEAEQMDPQQRLFLEVAIRALNHANLRLDGLYGTDVGVYCGVSTHEYSQLNYKDKINFNKYTQIGAANSAVPGRLSHFLNLTGPSLAIDTACSSSLAALYLAANGLRSGQCSLAIVGGVHLNFCPENFVSLTKANMLSASGECRSFDSQADGFVRSEGAAVVVIKRLSEALSDHDTIYAVIKSVALNHDGESSSLLAPNQVAQVKLHQMLLKEAELAPIDVQYIEAHGSGTLTGDAVEFNAIQQVYQESNSKRANPLIIGAVKSNIGHSISVSGFASLFKVIASLHYGVIPPNLHYQHPNASIQFDPTSFIIPVEAQVFPAQEQHKRYAQVSNFGFSGTNAGLIIEEPPRPLIKNNSTAHSGPCCFIFSANSEYSLQQVIVCFKHYLQQTEDNLLDISLTLINCRDHYKYRCAIIASNKEALKEKIEKVDYEIRRVPLNKEMVAVRYEAQAIYDAYYQGANLKIEIDHRDYKKVNLPLYCFQQKSYWHKVNESSKSPKIGMNSSEDIAIIGMGCRLPKANDVSEFLRLLEDGLSGITDIPLDRWNNDEYYDADPNAPGKLYIKQLGLIDHIKEFDADFFNISPREAKYLAPQLRVCLETSYHALENADLSLEMVAGSKTGVFIGVGSNEYWRIIDQFGKGIEERGIYHATGNAINGVAGRIAYFFNFHGPIQVIDTACSSSLTAIHNACLSLHAGECAMAIAGGVNTILVPDSNVSLSKAKMLSPDSRCKTFSADADGYARSEGCGIVILKPLSKALADQDNVLAVIKGSAVNHDGKTEGFTVPNQQAQEELIRHALINAQLTAAEIDCIETHGTGTPLADPIEVRALENIFSSGRDPEHPLVIGSVKTNIGHCESASGVAGLIKAVLSIQHQRWFKHLNFTQLNPKIQLNQMVIPLEATSWNKKQGLRAIGVSSFGFSGANAHIIVQEILPTANKERGVLPAESLLVLSAKSKRALQLLLLSYQQYLTDTNEEFVDICYTAAVGRSHFTFRVAIKASSATAAAEIIALQQYIIYSTRKPQSKYVVHNNLDQLQEAYQQGEHIDWKAYYASLGAPFKKVCLPLYQFSRNEYWFNDHKQLHEVALPDDWTYQLHWFHKDFASHHKDKRPGDKPWLLIGDQQLIPALREKDIPVVTENELSLNYDLDYLIFAPNLASSWVTDISLQKNYLKQLLDLIKQLRAKSFTPRLIILTCHATAVLTQDKLNLNSSVLLGFVKTLQLELPQYRPLLIDLDEVNPPHIESIIDEVGFYNETNYEHVVAYRGGKRWVPRLQPFLLHNKKIELSSAGRYLVTGGSGGLGLVSVQALLALGAREVIIVARSMNNTLVNNELQSIRAFYSDRIIEVKSVDVTDKQSLAILLTTINADGLLKGIIHAAGAAIKAPLLEHQHSDIDHVFAAKVEGAWHLHELTQHMDLDFFILYSSIAAAFGSNKESIYSAANSFLDALVAERRRLGLTGSTIQWGPWADVGMAKARTQVQGLKNALISKQLGYSFMRLLFNNQLEQLAIISPDYLRFMLDFVKAPKPLFYTLLEQQLLNNKQGFTVNSSSWLDEYFTCPEKERLTACQHMVTNLCQLILELPITASLDQDNGFFDLGFDSLMMTELAYQLKEKVKAVLDIPVTIGFEYPSINQLAAYLYASLKPNPALSIDATTHQLNHDIAIIGMSGVFPNAGDLETLKMMLKSGASGLKTIDDDRWDHQYYYSPNPDTPGTYYINKLGLMDDIKGFDAHFFGISPREAPFLEPQQRLFLEQCYKAIENANYAPSTLRGSLTGVFAGVGPNEYFVRMQYGQVSADELSAYTITGNALNLIPGRVTYFFDFKGPAITVDTACSSSLVALHYACQSLRQKEIDYALVGGINVLLMPESNVRLCKVRALSPHGRCNTFDAAADGYARGEGCGVLMLKRAVDATRDKDNVLAIIKASAVNNDGKSAGLTVPNGKSQEAVMTMALTQSRLNASDISYIEAHGTATPLGDPIEVQAINQVYGDRTVDNPLYLGTVKTNIGHLESASGIAGVIKTVIGLQNRTIYKPLHFKTLNPKIELKNAHIPLTNMTWQSPRQLNSAAVNAFGFSGTNAHVILQEYRQTTVPTSKKRQKHLLVLSAKSKISLERLMCSYKHYLLTTQDDFADICYTAATCRDHYPVRMGVLAYSAIEASQKLALIKGDLEKIETEPTTVVDKQIDLLLKDYLQGVSINWSLYYEMTKQEYQKVILPNYVFDKVEYWLAKKEGPEPSPIVQPSSVDEHGTAYHLTWHLVPHVLVTTTNLPDFVVIAREQHKAQRLLAGISYSWLATMDEKQLRAGQHIIFIYEPELFYDLVRCCQHLFKVRPHSFTLVTEGAYAVVPGDKVNPYHTQASSFWKSFANEFHGNNNFLVDIAKNSVLSATVSYFLSASFSPKEKQYALREQLYVPHLVSHTLKSPQQNNLFKPEAVYLITGGTGGLAQILMEYLKHRGIKHIILVSRGPCSFRLQQIIQEAKKDRVTIEHHCADVSDKVAMQAIFMGIRQQKKIVKGIFHLAGMVLDKAIPNLTEKDFAFVHAAKVEGALILHELTKELDLDLFVLFSSSASVLGAKGQSNYASANGFLDGLAYLRQQEGVPALSINWGPFDNVGMTKGLSTVMQQAGFKPLSPSSIMVLDQLMQEQYAQVMVLAGNENIFIHRKNNITPIVTTTANEIIEQLKEGTKSQRIQLLSKLLVDSVATALHINDKNLISSEEDLFSLGLDSLMALDIRSQIYDQLQLPSLSLPIEYFIHSPRITNMASVIADELQLIFCTEQPENKSDLLTETMQPLKKVALCDFQYIFWMLNYLGYDYNLGVQVRIHGELIKDYVEQALTFLVEHDSIFWLSFVKDKPIQIQRDNNAGEFKLIYHDFLLSEPPELNSLFYSELMEAIPLDKQPLLKVLLYRVADKVHELHIIIPHIIVDELSCSLFLQRFCEYYEVLSGGKSLGPQEKNTSFLNYVTSNNRYYTSSLKEKISFWHRYNQGYKKLYFGKRYHVPDAVLLKKSLLHYPLSSKVIERFVQWHQDRNINISTGLIAACQIALAKISGQKKIPIIFLNSGREGRSSRTSLGVFPEYKRINLSLNTTMLFADYIQLIDEEILKTAPYQKCSHFVKDYGLRHDGLSWMQYLQYLITKRSFKQAFIDCNIPPLLSNVYLKILAKITSLKRIITIKNNLNRLFGWHLSLQKPSRLRVIVSVTHSFFVKEFPPLNFANLTYSFPNYYATVDRPGNNKDLWIYFAQNEYGQYVFSIHGPLTQECKNEIFKNLNHILHLVIENEHLTIKEWPSA